jgi:hypothetical protein
MSSDARLRGACSLQVARVSDIDRQIVYLGESGVARLGLTCVSRRISRDVFVRQ